MRSRVCIPARMHIRKQLWLQQNQLCSAPTNHALTARQRGHIDPGVYGLRANYRAGR
jgi:hypothetical protein